MAKTDSNVTRFVRAERERRKWSQADLAAAAGGISRTTVASLEQGAVLREGKEAAIEAALGWEIGSLDAIRKGGGPIVANSGDVGGLYAKVIRDEAEQAIMDIDKDLLPEANKWAAIFKRRKKNAARPAAPVIIPLRRLSS